MSCSTPQPLRSCQTSSFLMLQKTGDNLRINPLYNVRIITLITVILRLDLTGLRVTTCCVINENHYVDRYDGCLSFVSSFT